MTRSNSLNKTLTTSSQRLGVVIVLLYACFIGLPILALVIKSASSGSVTKVLLSPITLQAIKLSLLTSLTSVIVILLIGTPVAYMISRSNLKFFKILDIFIELPIILPPIVAGVAMLMAFGRQGILGGPLTQLGLNIPFTTTAVVFAQIFVSAPFYIRAARISFSSIDTDIEDLSRTLGKSPWYTFWHITIPLTWTGLTTGLALTWARSLSEFGATIMFAGNMIGETQTMPLGILTAMETDLDSALSLSLILLLISLAILVGIHFLSNQISKQRI
tara:strand:- start:9302 stop:10126 length:825 start_codon:yes stop_codon:yes gene_type:complete